MISASKFYWGRSLPFHMNSKHCCLSVRGKDANQLLAINKIPETTPL